MGRRPSRTLRRYSWMTEVPSLRIIPDRLYYYVHHKGQATQRYDFSLWDSLIKMFETCQRLDTDHIACRGLRLRTWLYVNRTISDKMIPYGIGIRTFALHLSKVRSNSYMKSFFRQLTTGLGWKSNIKYWLIKLRLYCLCYCLSKMR